jgi:TetR/AcrR family transcriptional repressor of nem operon
MSKKQLIISIAREVIHSKGYHATSISDILHAAQIGKGQFYHYFSSKYDLGLAVVEDLIKEWDQTLIIDILQSTDEPKSKLNKMFDWAINSHAEMDKKSGCPVGNLAIELSEHEEEFRVRINQFFNRWIEAIEVVLEEMMEKNILDSTIDAKKNAQAIIASIEGGILLMKNEQDVQLLINVIDVARKHFNLC